MESASCNGDQAETGAMFVTDAELGGKYTTGFVAGANVRQDMIKVSLEGTSEQIRDYYNDLSEYYDEVSTFFDVYHIRKQESTLPKDPTFKPKRYHRPL